MPRNAVFSRDCWILAKVPKYRILSENGVVLGKNGVVNGVVKLGRRRQISEYEMNETHVLADDMLPVYLTGSISNAGAWVFILFKVNKMEFNHFS